MKPLDPLLLALCMALCPSAVLADIYILDQGQSESSAIHLTNIPGRTEFKLLVPANRPKSAFAAAPSAIPTPVRVFDEAIRVAAQSTGLPVALLHAVISAESGGNPGAVSPKGAQGLMQLMPAAASDMELVDVHDPTQNIMAGARYLKRLLQQFGSIELALAAYNAGPATVRRYGNRIPPYAETKLYVKRVMQLARSDQY